MNNRILWILCLLAWPMFAADITPGYTFVSGEQNITHTKLNNSASGSINSTFYSDKSFITFPTALGHQLLLLNLSSGEYEKTFAATFFYSSNIWLYQAITTAPSTNSQVLLYDPVASSYRRATIDTLFNGSGVIGNLSTTNSTNYGGQIVWRENGANWLLTRTNVMNGWKYWMVGENGITNLTELTAVTNQDRIWVWDDSTSSNKSVNLTNLFMGVNTYTNATNADLFSYYHSRSNGMAKMTLGDLKAYMTNGIAIPTMYTSTNAIPSAGAQVTFTHGLGSTPDNNRVTLLCVADDAATGYVTGDEFQIESCYQNTPVPLFGIYVNSTTVGVNRIAGTFYMRVKTTGAQATPTSEANFVVKVRAWK